MKILDYIPDATYTEPGYIAAVPRLHGELRFVFKPLLAEQRGPLRKAALMSDEAYAKAAAGRMVHHLVSWSLVDKSGQGVPITADALRRLKADLQSKLFDVIGGWKPSDIDPLWDDATKDHAVDVEIGAEETGDLPGEIREASDVKNSAAA